MKTKNNSTKSYKSGSIKESRVEKNNNLICVWLYSPSSNAMLPWCYTNMNGKMSVVFFHVFFSNWFVLFFLFCFLFSLMCYSLVMSTFSMLSCYAGEKNPLKILHFLCFGMRSIHLHSNQQRTFQIEKFSLKTFWILRSL